MNQPSILDEIELLRRCKTQATITNATLATSMTAFGWTWTEEFLTDLFEGRAKPDEEQREYIRRYLLTRYYDATTVSWA